MKKLGIVLVGFGLFANLNSLYSQFNGGIIGGLSTNAVEIVDLGEGARDILEGNNIVGYEAGLYLKYNAGSFYIKPMVNYETKSGNLYFEGAYYAFKSAKIESPLLFGWNLAGPFSIEAGPVYNYLLDVKSDYSNIKDWNYSKNGIGYRAGLAINADPIILNISYQGMTYINTRSQTKLTEPYKIVFGLALRLGGRK